MAKKKPNEDEIREFLVGTYALSRGLAIRPDLIKAEDMDNCIQFADHVLSYLKENKLLISFPKKQK